MFSLSEAAGRAISLASEVSKGRDFALDVPYLIYLVGWIFVLYLIFVLIDMYIAPAIFGNNYRRRPFGKNLPMQVHQHHNPQMRMAGVLPGMDENASTHLTATVTKAIDGSNQ